MDTTPTPTTHTGRWSKSATCEWVLAITEWSAERQTCGEGDTIAAVKRARTTIHVDDHFGHLAGKTVAAWRPLTGAEAEAADMPYSPVWSPSLVLIFTDGTAVVVSQDPEGGWRIEAELG